jgi:hypothetical protein
VRIRAKLVLPALAVVGTLLATGAQSSSADVAQSAAATPLFVAVNGSDGDSCTTKKPCQTINRAYHLARPGQVIQLRSGEYPEQIVLYDAAKEGAAQNVVVKPAARAKVKLTQLTIGPDRTTRGATHLTVEGVTILQDIAIHGCGAPVDGQECPSDSGGNHLTLRHLDVRGPYGFFCASCDHVSLLDSRVGPISYGSPCNGSRHPEVANEYDAVLGAKLKRPNHLLFQNVVFENFSRCTTSDHTECLQIEPADDVIIRGSVFRRCDTIDVNIANDLAGTSRSAAGYRAPNKILIENNIFAAATDFTQGPTYYALNIRECTNCTVRYNSWLQAPRMPTGEISSGNAFIGNVGPMPQWNCIKTGIRYSHNVWVGGKCGPTDKGVRRFGFTKPAALNLHLLNNSPAINAGDPRDFPPRDADGQRRPMGKAPDAGADEHQVVKKRRR